MRVEKEWSNEASPEQSPLSFRLDPASGVPTYLQLVHQVEHALRLGVLGPGDRLPRVREVVADLAINPNTVLKAYRSLELKGLVTGRPGQGTFVEGSVEQTTLADLAGLRRTLRAWLADADAAGLDHGDVAALVMSTLRETAHASAAPDVAARAERPRAGRVGAP
jgi:GntR family transcriptional regulator